MPNRFTGRIRRGEISSIEELKSEFKALAKSLHPDLLGPGASGAGFAELRAEYEDALRDFDRHRFGLGRSRETGLGESGNPARRRVHDRAELYAALAALRRRGFPKLPRHDKERMRYEYARFLFLAALSAWDEAHVATFRAFETEAFAADARVAEALGILDAILAWHSRGGDHVRRSIELECEGFALGRERGGEKRGPATEIAGAGPGGLEDFLVLLARDMALGPARGPVRRKGEGGAGGTGGA